MQNMFRHLVLLLSLVVSQSFILQPPTDKVRFATTTSLCSTTQGTVRGVKDELITSALKKASKTLAVAVGYNGPPHASDGDLSTLSMQIRKVNAAALVTSDLAAATAFVVEQAMAKGNFPGPCPVIYSGDDIEGAIQAGVDAVIVDASRVVEGIGVIRKVSSPAEVEGITGGTAYLIDAGCENLVDIISAIPAGSVVVASVKSMQNDNAELQQGKELRALGVTSVLLEDACVGDGEDVEYTSFAINGLTKKKSSTFNMSGLTGSTNGHFGGVASSTTTTWLRMKRK
ncbi:hypothetical protein MHU86_3958 [Fragilaria crotonensis]|nr:hypothetical protein MHU86_3958 [Fragilaria crotonensis]